MRTILTVISAGATVINDVHKLAVSDLAYLEQIPIALVTQELRVITVRAALVAGSTFTISITKVANGVVVAVLAKTAGAQIGRGAYLVAESVEVVKFYTPELTVVIGVLVAAGEVAVSGWYAIDSVQGVADVAEQALI